MNEPIISPFVVLMIDSLDSIKALITELFFFSILSLAYFGINGLMDFMAGNEKSKRAGKVLDCLLIS